MKTLLAALAGAQVDLQTTRGVSPLFVAAQVGPGEVVETLLEARAQVDLHKENGGFSLFVPSLGEW